MMLANAIPVTSERLEAALHCAEEALRLAEATRSQHDKHQAICDFRYEQIEKHMDTANRERSELRDLISLKISGLYGFLWKIAFGLIAAMAAIIIGFLAWFMNFVMTNTHP